MAKQRESRPKVEVPSVSVSPEPLLNRIWPFGLFVLLSLIFHWRILTSPGDQIIATLDIVHYFRWLHMYTYEEFMAGRVPLWNPYTYCGMPFAANPQATVFYPLSWLYMVVDIFQAQKFMIAMHSMLAGSFMYLFLRELGAMSRDAAAHERPGEDGPSSRAGLLDRLLFPGVDASTANNRTPMPQHAAIIGAIAYMFGNYMMANAAVGHLTMIFTATWLPLAMFCYERALARGRAIWLMWAGMALGVQVLAGEPQNCYYSVVTVTVYGLVRSIMASAPPGTSWFKQIPRRVLGWGLGLWIVAIVSAGASMIQLLPTAEFARLSDRSTNNFTFATFMSQAPGGFLEFLVPWPNDEFAGLGVQRWGNFFLRHNWEYGAYIGLVTFVLAGASLAVRRNAGAWSLRSLGVLAIVLMLGGHTPLYHYLYEWMPGLSLFRIPARAIVILHFCLAAMAGLGAQHLFTAAQHRWQHWRWLVPSIGFLSIAFGALAITVLFVGVYRVREPEPGTLVFTDLVQWSSTVVRGPMIGAALAIMAVVGCAFIRNGRAAMSVLAVALSIDLFMNNPRMPLDRPPPLEQDPSFQLLTGAAGVAAAGGVNPFRVDCPPRNGSVTYLNINTAMAARVEVVNGYSPMSVGRFYRFVHFMRGQEPSNKTRHELPEAIYKMAEAFPLRILNVRFATRWEEQTQRFRAAESSPLPRAWIVDRAEVIADESKTLERLRDAAFDPSTTVILERPPRISMHETSDGSPRGSATFKRLSPGLAEIQTQSNRDGYLVMSEVFYPGWKATIDGQPAELERANDILTAVPLPAGSHTILYEFDPVSFKVGAAGSAATWLAASVIGLMDMRNRRRRVHAAAEE